MQNMATSCDVTSKISEVSDRPKLSQISDVALGPMLLFVLCYSRVKANRKPDRGHLSDTDRLLLMIGPKTLYGVVLFLGS